MRPAEKNINIDQGSDEDVGRVILSALIIALLCILALVRGCA